MYIRLMKLGTGQIKARDMDMVSYKLAIVKD